MQFNKFLAAAVSSLLILGSSVSAMGFGNTDFFGNSNGTFASQSSVASDQHGERGYSYIEGRVTRVADGDTLTIRDTNGDKRKVRLLGIDAPELKMEGGQQSKRHLERLLKQNGQNVKIYFPDRKKADRYGRVIGKVVSGDVDINYQMVRDGQAWYYRNYQKDVMRKDRSLYEDAMSQARQERKGLWASDNPEQPWEWRKSHRRN